MLTHTNILAFTYIRLYVCMHYILFCKMPKAIKRIYYSKNAQISLMVLLMRLTITTIATLSQSYGRSGSEFWPSLWMSGSKISWLHPLVSHFDLCALMLECLAKKKKTIFFV